MAAKQKKDLTDDSRITFSKDKLLTLNRYQDRKDLLGVLLEENKRYTINEADALIDSFMKGKVK